VAQPEEIMKKPVGISSNAVAVKPKPPTF
jgi:hypothetical protein